MTKSQKTKPKSSKGRTPARSAPVALSAIKRNRVPRVTQRGNKIVVSHCEYVADVISDVNNEFAYDVYDISPGSLDTFPWLSSIAPNYESFRFSKFNVHYKPSCSSTTGGKVVLAVDYDARDSTTNESKATLLQWESSVDSQVWEPVTHVSTVGNLNRVGPTRFISAPAGSSGDRLSSAGTLYVATTSIAPAVITTNGPPVQYVTVTLGELWIDYEVELLTPQLQLTFRQTGNPLLKEPQFQQLISGSAIFSTPTTDIVSVFASQPFNSSNETVVQGTNQGIRAVVVPPNTLQNQDGFQIVSGVGAFQFLKDFVGEIVMDFQAPSGWTASPPIPVPTFARLMDPGRLSPGLEALTNIAAQSPDLSKNLINSVINASVANLTSWVAKVAIQAGSFLLINTLSATATSIVPNAGSRGTFRARSCAFDASELLEGLDETPSSALPAPTKVGNLRIRPGRRAAFFDSLRAERMRRVGGATSATAGSPAAGFVTIRK